MEKNIMCPIELNKIIRLLEDSNDYLGSVDDVIEN